MSTGESNGRVAVVTGGASGIGLAMVGRFAAAGIDVVAADVDLDALERNLPPAQSGRRIVPVLTDVTVADDVASLAERALAEFGRVDIMCNNAGVMNIGLAHELDVPQWARVIDVNLWGVIHGIRTFLPLLLEQGEGHLVNVASGAGLVASPFVAPYCATKAAVIAISEAVNQELLLLGAKVRVSVVCPVFVKTGIADGLGRDDESENPLVAMVNSAFEQRVASGLDPAVVADQVLDAIDDGSFWVFPHEEIIASTAARFDAISRRVAPTGPLDQLRGLGTTSAPT